MQRPKGEPSVAVGISRDGCVICGAVVILNIVKCVQWLALCIIKCGRKINL